MVHTFSMTIEKINFSIKINFLVFLRERKDDILRIYSCIKNSFLTLLNPKRANNSRSLHSLFIEHLKIFHSFSRIPIMTWISTAYELFTEIKIFFHVDLNCQQIVREILPEEPRERISEHVVVEKDKKNKNRKNRK